MTRPEQLGSALIVRAAVLFVPDVLTLGDGGQQLLVRTLTSLDERPKLILGLTRSDTERTPGRGASARTCTTAFGWGS